MTSVRLWSRSTTMSSGSPGVLPWIAATTSSAVFTGLPPISEEQVARQQLAVRRLARR